MQKPILIWSAFVMVVAVAVWGCGKTATNSANSTTDSGEAAHDNADHEHADQHDGDTATSGAANSEITAALAELPADDRLLAEKQKVCPVTDELLGSMGAPIKVDVQGKPVFICCEGCKEELLARPDVYLAKLEN